MGKAWRPPDTKRQFHYHIKTHALERFRERVEEQFKHRSDTDLARLLDERVHAAIESGRFIDVIDRTADDAPTRVAIFESQTGEDFYCPMRPHLVGHRVRPGSIMFGPDANAHAVITCLTKAMADRNLKDRAWIMVDTTNRSKTLTTRPFLTSLPTTLPKGEPEPTKEEPTEPDTKTPEQVEHAAKTSAGLQALPPGWKSAKNVAERQAWARAYFMSKGFV